MDAPLRQEKRAAFARQTAGQRARAEEARAENAAWLEESLGEERARRSDIERQASALLKKLVPAKRRSLHGQRRRVERGTPSCE